MTDQCKICVTKLEGTSLEEHIADQHSNSPQSVMEVYPDRHSEMFDAAGELLPRYSDEPAPAEEVSDPEEETAPAETDTSEQTATGSETSPQDSGGSVQTSGGGQEVSPPSSSSTSEPGSAPMSGATGKKWMMIGVGGAGNHIMDAVLLRRDTLREQNSNLANVWEGGIANYGNLNTNHSELSNTYYAREDRGFTRESLITNCMIGYREHNYSGAGRKWKNGRDLMQCDFEGEKNAIRDRLDLNWQDIEGSQAVMLINSVTKGTGCGATPVLAKNIREYITEGTGTSASMTVSKPILSSVVLPTQDEFRGGEMINGVVGASFLSKQVDGIIPFDNSKLDDLTTDLAVDIDTEKLSQYNPPQYTDINRVLVTFLEAFTMSSTPQSADTAGTARINGDVFDVSDSFRPVERKYTETADRPYTPAVVMAPVIGKISASDFDRSRLDTLARSTLLQGQLVEFDPKTAWGGTFMIYGPEEKMENLAPLLSNNELKSILSGEDFLARDSFDGPGSIDIFLDQLVVPHVDDVYLWGLLWNPRLPTLERMYDHARDLVENSDSRVANELREKWEDIEPLFECLGRQNLG